MHRATDPPPTLRNTQRVALGIGIAFSAAALTPKSPGINRALFALLGFLAFCYVAASEVRERYGGRVVATCATTRAGDVVLKLSYDPRRIPPEAQIRCYVSDAAREWSTEVDSASVANRSQTRPGEAIHTFPREFVMSRGRPAPGDYFAEWKLEYVDRQGAFVQRTVQEKAFRYGGRPSRLPWRRNRALDRV